MDISNDSDEEKDAKFKEFGPITPDDKDQPGFGGFLSSFFKWRKSKGEGENPTKRHESEPFNNAPYPIWLPPSENAATAHVDSGSLTNVNTEAHESGRKKFSLGSESVTVSYERHLHYVLKRIKTIAEKKDSDMKDHWVPDSHRKECYDCSEKFTQLRRKHHCRICGQIFCSKCCNKVISTRPMGFKGELKVCTYCFKVFSCCIKTNNFEEDVMADIILLEEELLPVVNASNLPSGKMTGEHERRLILEKRKRRGFMEENYTVKSRNFTSDFTSRVDQNDLDKIASERQLLLKDSQQLQSLWMSMVSGQNKLHLSTNRHRLKAFSETFIGRDFVQWMVDNDKASCRQSAIAIGQALLEAGFIFCVSQQEQQFLDEHVLYTPLKPDDFKEKTTPPQSSSVSHDMGQEPLWLKQISSQVESDNILPSKASFSNAPYGSHQNISASSSLYSLDLNVKESVVSLKHPGRRKGDSETETDTATRLETSISAVLNDSIYSFTSEQQSSGTVMTEEVLEALKSLEPKLAETRAAGWQIKNEDENLGREVEVDEHTKTSLIAKKKLSENWRQFENRLLVLLLSNMEIDISWSTSILSLIYKVVDTVCPDVKNESDDMDIRQYIQIKKVSGGKRNECRIINGTVCTKNISDREMKSRLSDPQILIIASHIDFQRRNEPFKENSMRNELNQEEEYIKNAVSKILSYKPDILITKGKVSYLAKNYLKNADVTVVMNVKTSVIDRIARCTQAQVIPCVDALAANLGAKELPIKPLGMCHSFYIRSFGSYNTKHLMFFDGCATHLGCTVILRGATNKELKGVKRVMSFMIFALYNWKLEKAYMMDIFASVVSLKIKTSLSFDRQSPVKEKVECKENTVETTREAIVMDSPESPVKTLTGGKYENSSFPLHSTPNKITEANLVSDKSDPLQCYLSSSPLDKPEDFKNEVLTTQNDVIPFSYALERNILTISPYIEFSLPYLESDKGKKSPLRRFFNKQMYFSDFLNLNKPKKSEYIDSPSKKEDNPNVIFKPSHYFVTATLTKPASDASVQAALADFRARGGTIQNVCRCSLKTHDDDDDEVKLSVREEIKKMEVEIEERKKRENLKKFYFTEEGKIDALHPFNHQRISVLFSSFSQSFHFNSTFCVTPSVLTMDFYGRNDINLGAFLERYCFNSSYKCLSAICTAPFLHHVRKFVHGSGCIEILLRQMESSLDEIDSTTIYMWSWCKICRQVSPVVPMSSDTWTFSFAKYLEFRFQESKSNRRGAPGCCHSIHRDHFHYFGQKDLVAVFKYISIPTRELVIPPSEIEYVLNPLPPSVIVDMIKTIAIQGYGVFSSIVDRLSTISEEIGQRWDPLLESVATHHQKQKQMFRESIEKIQLQLTSPPLEKRRSNQEALKFDKELANILYEISDQIVLLKGLIVQVVQDWNSKVQDLLNLRKKDEKDRQRTNSGNMSRQSGSQLSSVSTLTGSVEQLHSANKEEIISHQEISDSAEHTKIEDEKGDVFPEEQRNECSTIEENKASGIENKKIIGTQKEEKITDHRTLHSFAQILQDEKSSILSVLQALNNVPSSPTSAGHSCRSSPGVLSPTSGGSISHLTNDTSEKDVSGGIHAVLGSQGSELTLRQRQISNTLINARSGLEQFIPTSRVGHHERSFSDESEAAIARDILERIPEKRYSSSVKNIISTLWSSSADMMIKSPFDPTEHYNILPEVKIPVVINDDEPSSIIAKALASQEYETKLHILQVKFNELPQGGGEISLKTTESLNSSPTAVSNNSQEGVATKGNDSDKQFSQKDMHIDLQWNDSHANYYCKILFVDQFRELRQLIFPSGEELFIRSLSRCVSWDARGGKSGSAFCKTVDDRFVLKEMSRFEINSFLEFAPAYIQYITNCTKKNLPTALTRIVGVYKIGYKNTLTNKAEKFDFLVMENLFYQRSISTKFDLKGSERNRKVKLTGKEESEVVLLDENLLQMACSSPFYLRPHGKDVLTRAIVEDSNFLSQQFIMDYSLLVGVDEENNELVVGIIDYIRTFTWDKKLETIIKGSRLAGGAGKSPTILSPDSYRNRFCLAMESYFVLAPDRWTSFQEGVSFSE